MSRGGNERLGSYVSFLRHYGVKKLTLCADELIKKLNGNVDKSLEILMKNLNDFVIASLEMEEKLSGDITGSHQECSPDECEPQCWSHVRCSKKQVGQNWR